MTPEAADHQRLSLPGVGGDSTAVTNSDVTIYPVAHLASLRDEDFKDDSMLVAIACVKGDDYKPLGLKAGQDNFLYLFKDAKASNDTGGKAEWKAIMQHGEDTPVALEVAHYSYKDLPKNELPAVARLDTVAGTRGKPIQVIGIQCGKAWCMVGVAATYDGPDPDTLSKYPWRERPRGWVDWAPNKSNQLEQRVVVPEPSLRGKGKKAYKDTFALAATIYTVSGGKTIDTITVSLRWQKDSATAGGWRIRYAKPGKAPAKLLGDPVVTYTKHRDRSVPGVARWDNSPLPRTRNQSNNKDSIGQIWIRCASGCCLADVYDPI
jgi:hypothetical protein